VLDIGKLFFKITGEIERKSETKPLQN
jgi:hypothetical protein